MKNTIEIDYYSPIDFPVLGEVFERDGKKYKVIDNAVRNVSTAEEIIN